MGNLISSSGDERRQLRLLLIGMMGTGKTTLLAGVCREMKITIPTIGMFIELGRADTANTDLGFISWYVGGSEKIRALWRCYYTITNGLVFMVDSCGDYANYTKLGFRESRKELLMLLREDDLAQHPVLILANKQECADAKPTDLIEHELGLTEIVDWTDRGVNAFLMGTHPRAGAESEVRRLSPHLLQYIWTGFVQPLQYWAPAAILNGRPCRVQGSSMNTGQGVSEGIEWINQVASLELKHVGSPWKNWEALYETANREDGRFAGCMPECGTIELKLS